MKMRLFIVAALFLVASAGLHAIPVAISNSESVEIVNGDAEVWISGTLQVTIAIAKFPCGVGETVASITYDGDPLTVTSYVGCLDSLGTSEMWTCVGGTGYDPVVITLSESNDGEAVVMVMDNTDTGTPLVDVGISVGQGISSATLTKAGGDATIIVVFSDPSSATLSTPTGFVETRNDVIATGVRVAIFFDADASQATATLTFSGNVNYVAYILGVNNND